MRSKADVSQLLNLLHTMQPKIKTEENKEAKLKQKQTCSEETLRKSPSSQLRRREQDTSIPQCVHWCHHARGRLGAIFHRPLVAHDGVPETGVLSGEFMYGREG